MHWNSQNLNVRFYTRLLNRGFVHIDSPSSNRALINPFLHYKQRKPIFIHPLPGASVRNSAHGKGHEEGGLAYAKAWSSLRKPPVPEHLTPKPESVLCSHLHLWLYGGLSPITVSLGEGINMQLQGNKNSWEWQECFSLRTPLKVI